MEESKVQNRDTIAVVVVLHNNVLDKLILSRDLFPVGGGCSGISIVVVQR